MSRFIQRTHDEDDESNGGAETTTGSKKKATPVKATTSTKSRAPANDEDESREGTNDEDSNSVDPAVLGKKRNGKPLANDAGASGSSSNRTSSISLSHPSNDFR